MLTCRAVLTVIVNVCVLGLAMSVGAAPKADLWPRWQQHNAQNPAQIDFTFWNGFLPNAMPMSPLPHSYKPIVAR